MEKKPKILVVDDEEIFREVFREHFARENFDVLTASDGKKVIEDVKKDGINVILLDSAMSPISGIDVLEEIKEDIKAKNIKVIMMAHMGEEDYIAKARKFGIKDYFIKATLKFNDLSNKVNSLLYGQT